VPHDVDLIILLAVGFGIALIFGYIAARLRLPPFIGYLIAGIIISPNTPGIVADIHLANQLAELGVMFLMFGVGMHFPSMTYYKFDVLPYLVLFYKLLLQLAWYGVSMFWGWSFGSALVFGLSLSCASTVVLLKALGDRGLLDSVNGKIAVGWLLVEDLVMVLVGVITCNSRFTGWQAISTCATDQSIWITLASPYSKLLALLPLC
jgi:CPA2 family monovalent cation:H+ antiporter-2